MTRSFAYLSIPFRLSPLACKGEWLQAKLLSEIEASKNSG